MAGCVQYWSVQNKQHLNLQKDEEKKSSKKYQNNEKKNYNESKKFSNQLPGQKWKKQTKGGSHGTGRGRGRGGRLAKIKVLRALIQRPVMPTSFIHSLVHLYACLLNNLLTINNNLSLPSCQNPTQPNQRWWGASNTLRRPIWHTHTHTLAGTRASVCTLVATRYPCQK